MNVLIIGNGFDLAHGLPTRYTDFLRYCRDYSGDEPISEFENISDEFASIINDNLWLKYFLTTTNNLDDSRTWIDFENEIAEIVRDLDEAEVMVDDFDWSPTKGSLHLARLSNSSERTHAFIGKFTGSSQIAGAYKIECSKITDTESLINYMYSELRLFARAFEIYCLAVDALPAKKSIASTENIKAVSHLRLAKFAGVLSFNYTNTYERLYGNETTKFCYIHGKAQKDSTNTNIIFGIDDDLTLGEESKNFKWVKFKKYYQRIILRTGSEYKDWPDFIHKSNSHLTISTPSHYLLYIVGHSLDKTDHDVLYEFFSNELFKIVVCYYSSDDFDGKVQKVIQLLAHKGGNGRDELIRRVHGEQWSIKFVDQYDEKYGLFVKLTNNESAIFAGTL